MSDVVPVRLSSLMIMLTKANGALDFSSMTLPLMVNCAWTIPTISSNTPINNHSLHQFKYLAALDFPDALIQTARYGVTFVSTLIRLRSQRALNDRALALL